MCVMSTRCGASKRHPPSHTRAHTRMCWSEKLPSFNRLTNFKVGNLVQASAPIMVSVSLLSIEYKGARNGQKPNGNIESSLARMAVESFLILYLFAQCDANHHHQKQIGYAGAERSGAKWGMRARVRALNWFYMNTFSRGL